MPAEHRLKWADFLDLRVEPDATIPLFRQVYLCLRTAIIGQSLAPGSRLPSTRELARKLGVSRTSVLSAYDQLLAEGYVEGRAGSGTYVSSDLPEPVITLGADAEAANDAARARRLLSTYGERCRAYVPAKVSLETIPFITGRTSIDAQTVEAWRAISSRRLRTADPMDYGYSDPFGLPALRREIAEYLRAARAVRCEPEQILIVSGAQQAIDLSLRVLLNPGDAAWVEDPCYPATRAALQALGARIVPVPVDDAGIVVAQGIEAEADARLAYVTPSHQYPSGAAMSMARRLELLEWARSRGAWIIEDDYDSEFRYAGRPLASLQGLLQNECVIYVGTLSKVLFPGVRVGFAVVPRDLTDAFAGARFLADRFPSTLQQAVVADFLREGFLTSHIRRMRQRYREARDFTVEAVSQCLGPHVDVETPECGMQLVAYLAEGLSDTAVVEAAQSQGVVVRPVSPMYIAAPPRQGVLLGFTGFSLPSLQIATERLANVIERTARGRRAAPPVQTAPR